MVVIKDGARVEFPGSPRFRGPIWVSKKLTWNLLSLQTSHPKPTSLPQSGKQMAESSLPTCAKYYKSSLSFHP
jgi:hypothetical protein